MRVAPYIHSASQPQHLHFILISFSTNLITTKNTKNKLLIPQSLILIYIMKLVVRERCGNTYIDVRKRDSKIVLKSIEMDICYGDI